MILEKIWQMKNSVSIKEIFSSIQGEGPYIGYEQLFIRFSKCNLNCNYCDTDFKTDLKEYSITTLVEEVEKYKNIHSISLTGGEPLLDVKFLKEFLPLIKKRIYLETNGTLQKELKEIINLIDIISMDIKLNSTSKNGDLFSTHEEFIKIATENKKEIFIKIVFDENITEEEISKCTTLAKKFGIQIILQPKMDGDVLNISSQTIDEIFSKFITQYENVRLIPQVHKFLNVR